MNRMDLLRKLPMFDLEWPVNIKVQWFECFWLLACFPMQREDPGE